MKFTISVDCCLVIILSLSDLCLGVEERIFKEIIFSLHDLQGLTLAQKPSIPGVMKFTILVDPSLVIITSSLVCLIYAWE